MTGAPAKKNCTRAHEAEIMRRIACIFFLAFCLLLTYGRGAPAQTENFSEIELSKTIWQLAETYVQTVRRWEPEAYILEIIGKYDTFYVVAGYLIKDREDEIRRIKEHPDKLRVGHYPSEFELYIDFDKREVVKDWRPGQKDLHPRP